MRTSSIMIFLGNRDRGSWPLGRCGSRERLWVASLTVSEVSSVPIRIDLRWIWPEWLARVTRCLPAPKYLAGFPYREHPSIATWTARMPTSAGILPARHLRQSACVLVALSHGSLYVV